MKALKIALMSILVGTVVFLPGVGSAQDSRRDNDNVRVDVNNEGARVDVQRNRQRDRPVTRGIVGAETRFLNRLRQQAIQGNNADIARPLQRVRIPMGVIRLYRDYEIRSRDVSTYEPSRLTNREVLRLFGFDDLALDDIRR